MITFLVFAGAVAGAPDPGLAEARHALDAGRLDQARIMVTAAIASGAKGDPVNRILADIAFAGKDHDAALARYAALSQEHPEDSELMERAAIAAVRLGKADYATAYAERAAAIPGASWRTWNLLGALADLRYDFETADMHYGRALELAPNQADLLNNIGWSHLLRGDWRGALPNLALAADLKPKSQLIANNLELATAALSNQLPARHPGETDMAWAARLNDAGMAAEMRGEHDRAIAAFAQALATRSVWYERAANNLASAEHQK